MCDEPHDDQLTDAVFLELQIQICVGETAGTPMLSSNDFARLRLELSADLAAHVPYSKDLCNHAAF